MMEEAFRLIDDPDGEGTYLRLSTRSIEQVERTDDELERRRARRRLLAARAGAGRRSGDRRDGRGHARSARRLGGAERRHSRPRPARRHLARPAPSRLDRGAGRALEGGREPSHIEQLLSQPRARRRPGHHRRRRAGIACHGSAACSASASRRSASRTSARPATSPTSTPPTASTAPRSPRPLPSCCCLPRERRMAGRYFDEWQVGDRSSMRSPARSPRPTMS